MSGHFDRHRVRHRYGACVREVAIGEWGTLFVFNPDEEVPGLRGAESFWVDDDHRRPVLLRTRDKELPFVAVWPASDPAPASGDLTQSDLGRVLLAEPTTSLHCFACGATLSGLYVDSGLPFFRAFESHSWLEQCPRCAARTDVARLQGVLAAGF